MRKFFVKNENINDEKIEITGSDVNHIKNVLRLKPGEKVQICNQETLARFEDETITPVFQLAPRLLREVMVMQVQSHNFCHLPVGVEPHL